MNFVKKSYLISKLGVNNMAVFISLHNGKTLRNLRNIIRYNTNDKKGINNKDNPRLIGVHSNVGDCESVLDTEQYQNLMDDFALNIEANSMLKTNKRQKYIYEHSTISFEMEDDEKLGMKKATALALEIAKKANPNGAPQMLWPQIDTDKNKLHFHLVRGLHDENGKYQKKSNDFHEMNSFLQKIEKKHNLVLTGKNNPDNYIWKTLKNGKKKKTYFPKINDNSKVSKNKNIDIKIKIDDEGRIKYIKKINGAINKAENQREIKENKKERIKLNADNKVAEINQENTELKKPVKYNAFQKVGNFLGTTFLVNETTKKYKDRTLLDEKVKSNEIKIKKVYKKKEKNTGILDKDLSTIENHLTKLDEIIDEKKNDTDKEKQVLAEKIAKDKEFTDFRDIINNAYRSSTNAETFLQTLNEHNIETCVSYRKNSGGISFNALNNDISMAGGKVNSYLTFGKIKKNDPDLFALLTGETGFGEITLTNRNNVNNNINIEVINKNYKQKINDDGSTSIFYNKKDAEKYPHNHNLKINADKNKISFGQFSNNHDIKLAYDLAKKEKWTNAKSDNKELIQKSMAIAFAENKEDLFFFQTKEPTLKFEELKNIIGDNLLSKDNLIKLYDNNLVVESDKKEVLVFIKNQLKEHKEDITTINSMLADNHSLKECIEKNEKIEKQKEEQKTINEQKLKVIDKRSNLKNDQISEPKPKRAKSSRNRI